MKYKQVILVRKDLKLGVGKLASQVAHAAIGAMKHTDETAVEMWEHDGSKKVVLKINNLKDLDKLKAELKRQKIFFYTVKDAGLTQLKAGTVTALGIGPVDEKKIDKITGKLKLL